MQSRAFVSEDHMIARKWVIFFIVLNLILINGLVLAVMNLRYPLVGHDYTYSLPSFLDTAIHYRLNGPVIQWFTPTFGGGLPAFPNPNHMQYSIPSLLAVVLPPWPAMMTSAVIFVSSGFLASYYFFRRTLGLNWAASLLGAFFFSANGFVITRFATGQLGYFSFPLLPLFLLLLLDTKLPARSSLVLFGILFATYIYSAGYFIIIIFGLSILMLLPMLFLFKSDLFQWKRLLTIAVLGGGIGILISSSKLAASFALMRYFPRLIADNYPVSAFSGLLGMMLQLLGTPSMVPLFLLAGLDPSTYPTLTRAATGTHYGMWELDISITPVVFIILLVCLIKFLHNPRKYIRLIEDKRGRTAFLVLALFTWVTIEFILAKGFFYPVLRQLPILSSLRGNVRFTGAFLFPLAFLSAAVYNHWSAALAEKNQVRRFLLVSLLAVIPLGAYFLFDKDMFQMIYDIAGPEKIYEQIRAGDSFEIVEIGKPEGENTGALLYRTSNLNLYEPIFGFELEYFHPQVENGSIWDISHGSYNMTDPTGYIYPELNGNRAFDRFRLKDKESLELFAKHIQPDWKIPSFQRVLDWISGLAFLLTVFYVFSWLIFGRRNRPRA